MTGQRDWQSHPTGRWTLAVSLLAGLALGPAFSQAPTGPVSPPPSVPHYAQDTPSVTRVAHRAAMAALREREWVAACDSIAVLPDSERRALTYYLELLCIANQPDRALWADRYSHILSVSSASPPLLESERRATDRYFAWIAAVQDELADEAERRGFDRPLPPWLRGTKDLMAVAGWNDRGKVYDAETYNRTRSVFGNFLQTLDGKLAMVEVFSGLNRWTSDSVLYADLSDLRLPPLPEASLPADDQL